MSCQVSFELIHMFKNCVDVCMHASCVRVHVCVCVCVCVCECTRMRITHTHTYACHNCLDEGKNLKIWFQIYSKDIFPYCFSHK